MATKSQLQGELGLDGNNPVASPMSVGPYSHDQDMDYKALLGCSGHFKLNKNRFYLVEHFNQLPGGNGDVGIAFNRDFEVLGTNADEGDVTFAAEIGAVQMQTDASGASQVIILPHLNSEQSAWTGVKWGNENRVIWETVIRTGASVADIIIWAGLKLTNDQDITADNDQAFFRFDTVTANWEAVWTVGGVADNETDTGVVVAASTNYYFRIEIDSSRIPHFYIDDNEVATGTALTDDVNLIPYVGVEGNAKTINLVSTAISRMIFENP